MGGGLELIDKVTFLRPRDSGRDLIGGFEARIQGQPTEIYYYARRAFPVPEASAGALRDEQRFGEYCAALVEDLRSKGQGGLLVRLVATAKGGTVEVRGFPAEGFEPPSRFLYLRPGHAAFFEEVRERPTDCQPADRFLVPVDSDSERRLESLLRDLSYLPGDLEDLVVNALRRPGIEARLSALESRVWAEGTPWQASSVQRKRRLRRILGALRRPAAILLPTIAVLLLLLGQWRIHRALDQLGRTLDVIAAGEQVGGGSDPQDETNARNGEPAADGAEERVREPAGGEPPAPEPVRRELVLAVRELADAVRTPREARVRALYAEHFEPLTTVPEEPFSVAALPWGLAKLAALRAGASFSYRQRVSAEERSVVKDRLRRIEDSLSAAEKAAIAFASCRVYRFPGLPERSGDKEPAALSFFQSCAEVDQDDALRGYEELRRWAK